MSSAINTAKVSGRRELHFNSLEDIRADVERLANAKEVRALGNCTAVQVVNHLATVMNKSIDGFEHRPAAPIRFFVRLLFKRRFLTRPMSAGFNLTPKMQGELYPPAITLDAAVKNFSHALQRLKNETRREGHPVLGPLTPSEWEQLHCRHSELHLSFLVPVDA
jgi:hypothetical protein